MIGGILAFILMLWGPTHITPGTPAEGMFNAALTILIVATIPCWLAYILIRTFFEIVPAVAAIVRGMIWMRRSAAPYWRSGWRAAGRIIGNLFQRPG